MNVEQPFATIYERKTNFLGGEVLGRTDRDKHCGRINYEGAFLSELFPKK